MANSTFDASQHWTSRDFKTSERLRLQHFLVQRHIKFLLDPSIEIEATTIADIGCANGAWLIDVAEEYPNTQLTGFDLSPNLFPPTEWLSDKITFKTLDILAPSLTTNEQFDVINARFLVTIFKGRNPSPFLTNAAKMVKNGGHLQWVDIVDFDAIRSFLPNSDTKHEATERVIKLSREFFGEGGVDLKYLKGWESDYKLKIVHQEDVEVPASLRQGYTEACLHALYEIE